MPFRIHIGTSLSKSSCAIAKISTRNFANICPIPPYLDSEVIEKRNFLFLTNTELINKIHQPMRKTRRGLLTSRKIDENTLVWLFATFYPPIFPLSLFLVCVCGKITLDIFKYLSIFLCMYLEINHFIIAVNFYVEYISKTKLSQKVLKPKKCWIPGLDTRVPNFCEFRSSDFGPKRCVFVIGIHNSVVGFG